MQTEKLERVIDRRVGQIIAVLHKIFKISNKSGNKINWWYPNAEPGGTGTIDLSEDYVCFQLGTPQRDMDSGKLLYNDEMPLKFLTMTDEQMNR